MASQAGASYIRLIVRWASIAPSTLPPPSWNPTDPTSPYYHWSALDSAVSAETAAGLSPIIDIVGTPSWAYHVQPQGTWKAGQPDLTKLGQFATAIASRYDGTPEPAVHAFAVWNEANFNRNLWPQDPTYYRSMVNAVADSVHALYPTDLVLAGELAPFKHTPSKTDKNNVIPPLTFMHTMLCISSTTPAHRTCNTQAKFNVWDHHPYSDTGPYGHATATGGVELGDLPKMNKLLQTAKQLGAISSTVPVQFWVTEFGWSTRPPNHKAAPLTLVARWMGESFYQMWKSGVTVGTWFALQDLPSSTPFQCGLYYDSPSLATAQAKPLLAPFHFPFVAYLKSGGKVQVWGRDPANNQQNVTIQERKGRTGAWRAVGTITSNSNGIFLATMPLHAMSTWWMRAVVPGSGPSSGTSIAFALAVPSNENLRVSPFPLDN